MRHSEVEQEEEEHVFCLLAHEKMRLVLNAAGISIPACASFQAAGASDLPDCIIPYLLLPSASTNTRALFSQSTSGSVATRASVAAEE